MLSCFARAQDRSASDIRAVNVDSVLSDLPSPYPTQLVTIKSLISISTHCNHEYSRTLGFFKEWGVWYQDSQTVNISEANITLEVLLRYN